MQNSSEQENREPLEYLSIARCLPPCTNRRLTRLDEHKGRQKGEPFPLQLIRTELAKVLETQTGRRND